MPIRSEGKRAGKESYDQGIKCFQKQKYAKAELLLRKAARYRQRVLGAEHEDTLKSKAWLARTLHRQEEESEAEQLLLQVVQQQEKVLGTEDLDTLESKYWLAVTLHNLEKYSEAEQLLLKVVQQEEKVLGAEDLDTLESKYCLAVTLHRLGKYSEAEQLLVQVIQQQEKVLGAEDIDTLASKLWLARTLNGRQKHDQAEKLLRDLVQLQEKAFGAEHEETLKSKHLLEEVQLALASLVSISAGPDTALNRLSDFFVEGDKIRAQYNDSEISQISRLLHQLNPRWGKIPRTYIVLRNIGCLSLIETFLDAGFSDYWFPVMERSLPRSLHPTQRSRFVAAQSLVLTKSMDLEKGESGQHCYFQRNEHIPFDKKSELGSGGFARVDKVLSEISFREYARKRVPRDMVFGGRGADIVKQFIAEIEILKRLKHRHVVEFVGSYTDSLHMALIMSPVAEMDLNTYLKRANAAKYGELRTFFGCLAWGLKFLHEQNVRHKDIKPRNILVQQGNILFTDFGLSFDFTDAEGSTTVSMVNGMTRRYCAPEVAMQDARNTSSDIWSLGVVFLEMTVVLKGRTIESMYEFLQEHGSRQEFVRTNPLGFYELLAELKEAGSQMDNVALGWTQDMLVTPAHLRPTAASLAASITATGRGGEGSGSFCGSCCPDDGYFDGSYDLDGGMAID